MAETRKGEMNQEEMQWLTRSRQQKICLCLWLKVHAASSIGGAIHPGEEVAVGAGAGAGITGN